VQLGTNFGELELRDDFKFVYRRREAIGRVVGFHLKVDNLEKEIIPCVKTAITRSPILESSFYIRSSYLKFSLVGSPVLPMYPVPARLGHYIVLG